MSKEHVSQKVVFVSTQAAFDMQVLLQAPHHQRITNPDLFLAQQVTALDNIGQGIMHLNDWLQARISPHALLPQVLTDTQVLIREVLTCDEPEAERFSQPEPSVMRVHHGVQAKVIKTLLAIPHTDEHPELQNLLTALPAVRDAVAYYTDHLSPTQEGQKETLTTVLKKTYAFARENQQTEQMQSLQRDIMPTGPVGPITSAQTELIDAVTQTPTRRAEGANPLETNLHHLQAVLETAELAITEDLQKRPLIKNLPHKTKGFRLAFPDQTKTGVYVYIERNKNMRVFTLINEATDFALRFTISLHDKRVANATCNIAYSQEASPFVPTSPRSEYTTQLRRTVINDALSVVNTLSKKYSTQLY